MQTFLHQYSADLLVMADLLGKIDREGLLRMRGQIDRMKSQNIRQAALAIWYAKARVSGAIGANPSS